MMQQKLEETDWRIIANEMQQNGFAILANLLSGEQCEAMKAKSTALTLKCGKGQQSILFIGKGCNEKQVSSLRTLPGRKYQT